MPAGSASLFAAPAGSGGLLLLLLLLAHHLGIPGRHSGGISMRLQLEGSRNHSPGLALLHGEVVGALSLVGVGLLLLGLRSGQVTLVAACGVKRGSAVSTCHQA